MPDLSDLSEFKFSQAYYMPLWYVYNAVFRSFGGYYLFQMVQAIIVNTVVLWFFRKHCRCYFTAMTVYFVGYYFSMNMDIMRQAICICIFLLSYDFLEKKKLVPYYVMSIIAIGFHMSAVFLLFVPLTRLSRKSFAIVGMVLLVVIFVFKTSGSTQGLESVVSKSGSYMWYYIIDRLHYYTESSHLNIIGMTVRFLVCVPFVVMIAVKWFVWKKHDNIIDNMMVLLVFVQISSMIFPAFGRFNYYLFLIGIVFLTKEISGNWQTIKSNQMVKLLVTAALFVYCVNISYYYIMNQYDYKEGAHVYHRYIPYHSVLNPVEDEFREDYLKQIHKN